MLNNDAEDESLVPPAPDPPESDGGDIMRQSRFHSTNDPDQARSLKPLKIRFPAEGDEKVLEKVLNQREQRAPESFHTTETLRRIDDEIRRAKDAQRKKGWHPVWFFIGGAILGSLLTLAGIVPLLTWNTDTERGQKNRSFYACGFFVGIAVFATAALTTLLVLASLS